LGVNANHEQINVEDSQNRSDSILNYYKHIIALRKKEEIIVYGDYDDIEYKHKRIYAYKRSLNGEKLTVICNYSSKVLPIKEYEFLNDELLLCNYAEQTKTLMKPYEARVYIQRKKVS
jgi:glycosidase